MNRTPSVCTKSLRGGRSCPMLNAQVLFPRSHSGLPVLFPSPFFVINNCVPKMSRPSRAPTEETKKVNFTSWRVGSTVLLHIELLPDRALHTLWQKAKGESSFWPEVNAQVQSRGSLICLSCPFSTGHSPFQTFHFPAYAKARPRKHV